MTNRNGDRDEPVHIVDYDPTWPDRFESERQLLLGVLGPWLAGPIEHVGSTAVPGLRAKPVIDIMAPVRSLDDSRPAIEAAVVLQYHYYPYRADSMHWFCKPSPAARTHHLHLVPVGSQLWTERLAFRDYLRSHPETAVEYAVLKERLAEEHRFDREAYTDAKGPFVQRVLGLARGTADDISVLPCNILASDCSEIVRAGAAEGFTFVARLHSEWQSGLNRFDKPRETFVGAFCGSTLLGVCGLNVDPYTDDPRVGRLQHLYVLPDHRHRGIGTTLVRHIVVVANLHFARLRLRTRQAGHFYEKLGFNKTDEPHATHTLDLPAEV